MRSRFHVLAFALCGALACGPAWPQAAPSGAPGAGGSAIPSAPPAPAPGVTITQPPPAGAQPPAPPQGGAQTPPAGAIANLPTLVPESGDSGNVDEVVLPAKPVAIMSGQSNWEDALKNLRAAIQHVRDELGKAGIPIAGRPLTVFVETSDESFKFDAMVPVDKAPEGTPAVASDIRFGTTPPGKAYRFVHKGPYDEIDSTYETITAYLDAKDIVAKDAFVEEYVNEVADPTDPNLEINIFVQPK
jgi:effector-binding domain-containing protein